MSDKKENEVCTICIEDLKPDSAASIECCEHKFCFKCIHEWAK